MNYVQGKDCFESFYLIFYVFYFEYCSGIEYTFKKTSEASRFLEPLSPEEAMLKLLASITTTNRICKILFDFVHRTEGVYSNKIPGVLLIDSKDQQIFNDYFLSMTRGGSN